MTPQISTEPILADLALRLGLGAAAGSRLEQMPDAPELELVDNEVAQALMGFCSVQHDDAVAMLAARPEPGRDADWWLLLRGAIAELRQLMDRPLSPLGYTAWPMVPGAAGPVGMFVDAWALLNAAPTISRCTGGGASPRR